MTSKEVSSNEYHPFYKPYIDLLDDIELIDALNNSYTKFMNVVKTLDEDTFNYRYAKGKWSVKELIQHLIDTERIMSYRALRFSRNDQAILQGFDENDYVENSNVHERNSQDLLKEFEHVRASTILLFKSFNSSMLVQSGNANNSQMSVRALGFMIAGHVLHHLNVLKERYLAS